MPNGKARQTRRGTEHRVEFCVPLQMSTGRERKSAKETDQGRARKGPKREQQSQNASGHTELRAPARRLGG